MPELPEVEIVVRGLKERISNKKISLVDVKTVKAVGGDVVSFSKSTVGASIKNIDRIGKLIIVRLSNDHIILIHLKLTGQLIYIDKNGKGYRGGHSQKAYDAQPPNKFTQVSIKFADGSHLYFNDLRKFGWMKITSESEFSSKSGLAGKILMGLGPDPTSKDFNEREIVKKIQRRAKASIYQVLMDQKVVAGLGNIYVNELLWRCKINPQTKVGQLSASQIIKLARGIKPLLEEAIRYGGSSANTFVKIDGSKGTFTDHLDVYHREGEKCHRNDGGTITRIKMGTRSIFFCPICQKLTHNL